MTDLAAIKDELRALLEKASELPWKRDERYIVGQVRGGRPGGEVIATAGMTWKGHDGDTPENREADAALIVAAVNALPALLADTPSVEPPKENIVQALPFPTTDASKWVAAFRETFPDANVDDGSMLGWFANAIEHGRGPDRPSVEPAGLVRTEASLHWALDATNPPPPEPDERTDRYYLYRKGWADRGNAIRDAALLPTQASDSPEKP